MIDNGFVELIRFSLVILMSFGEEIKSEKMAFFPAYLKHT